MSAKFALLVPVKALERAKSRLVVSTHGHRVPLMRAFALDAITAAVRSSLVRRVYVVTDEPGLELPGTVALPDEGEGDLNRALVHAALRVSLLDPSLAVAAMCADLPCLRTADLDDALRAGLSPRWFVADAAGTGSSLLAARPGVDLAPHFGPGSAAHHRASGAAPVRAQVPTLRMDVDTLADLDRARLLGVGEHTTAALAAADLATPGDARRR